MKPKTRKLAKGIIVRYAIATLCLITILAVSILHSKYTNENVSDVTKTYLSEISMQSAEMINRKISSDIRTLHVTARQIGSLGNFDVNKIRDILLNENLNNGFSNMGVMSLEGYFIVSTFTEKTFENLNQLNVSDSEYFKNAISGITNISGTVLSKVDNEKINIFATPIYGNGEVKGVLAAYFNNEVLSNSMCVKTFGGEGYSYIVDSNFNIIFQPAHKWSNHDNTATFESYINELLLDSSNKEQEQLKKDIRDRKSGTIEYTSSIDFYLSYNPLKYNNWYLISVVPINVAKIQTIRGGDDILRFIIYLLIILVSLGAYIVFIRVQGFKLLKDQKREQSINDASYRIIMDQTNDILFEYNTTKKSYIHSANFKNTFGYEPMKKGFLNALKKNYIHPNDVNQFIEAHKEMILTKRLVEAEIRIVKVDGEYLWTQLHMTGVLDMDGKLVRIIGRIVDIDKQKKAIDTLKEKAVLDSATGLYNKQTTEDLIIAYLNEEGKEGKHALLIIDIDNFKEINDDLGHRKGDMIISALGTEISKMFRTTDIIGRIGGDEFMVLIKNVEGTEFIIEKAKAICNIFDNKDLGISNSVTVSSSIGIAIYCEDGSTYEELYEAADQALYTCKDVEKGTFSFYNSNQLKINLW